jgi:hypothetical protein
VVWDGDVRTISVLELGVTELYVLPNLTSTSVKAPLINPEPWMTTGVPPDFGPLAGETEVIVIGYLLQSIFWVLGGYVVAVTVANWRSEREDLRTSDCAITGVGTVVVTGLFGLVVTCVAAAVGPAGLMQADALQIYPAGQTFPQPPQAS